ncbi:hypothetical protein EVAR_37592_1 [Eumeta japonica]|uniref:Transposable element P transposase-like RNase H domain-containing protein n=1 Tax=Eumeta variegata TaxID=151549 RepID=A0A4C1VNC9_EUMVA|nr:hypothetical protein EVAR_37592_1 [Eumeta japonica]
MTKKERLCILLFDENKITPHIDYNRRKDIIHGFVGNGYNTKRMVADHALVLMLRGVEGDPSMILSRGLRCQIPRAGPKQVGAGNVVTNRTDGLTCFPQR